jgi:uncharacterized membrane protein YesL
MLEVTGLTGGIYRIFQWVSRFSLTNILWLLFNIPVIYLIINVLYLENSYSMILNIVILSILLPFLFFPATTAMFGVVRQWVVEDEEAAIFKSFLKFYKQNYINSLIGGFIIVPVWGFSIFNFIYYSGKLGIMVYIIFIIVTMFLLVITCHFFAYNVHFEMRWFVSLKNAVYLCFGNVFHSIGIALTSFLIFYASFFLATFFIPFLMGSLFAFTAFLGYYYSLRRVQTMNHKKMNEIVSN